MSNKVAAEAAGLPPGVLNVVTADREVSELLVRDPRVDKITFTRSTVAGTFSQVRVGDPFDAQTQMGPLVASRQRQRDRVEGYIAQGIADGATLATGGGRPKHLERGWFVEPTVFGNVDNSSMIAQEEIFGPVPSVIPAENEQDCLISWGPSSSSSRGGPRDTRTPSCSAVAASWPRCPGHPGNEARNAARFSSW